MQISRFHRTLQILMLLGSGPRHSAAELAAEFQVSRRTIFRDVAFLREMGIQVFFDESNGAYRLAGPHPTSNMNYLSPLEVDELVFLILGANLSVLRSVSGGAKDIDQAIAKVLCRVPEATRAKVCSVLCAFESDAGASDRVCVGHPEAFKLIVQSIYSRRQIRIALAEDSARPWTTKLSPYRIIVSADRNLVVGRSSYHRKTCGFDLEEIVKVELTGDPYEIPKNWRHRSHSWALVSRSEQLPGEATVLLTTRE
jgi:predicted DNA-binding transcriptional regulator YafY